MPLVLIKHGNEIPDSKITELEAAIAEAMVAEAAAIGPEEAARIPNTDEFGILSRNSGQEDKGLTVEVYLYTRDNHSIYTRYWQAVTEAIARIGLTGNPLVQGVPKSKWRGWLTPSA